MLVTVDTNILIWGIRRVSIPEQTHMIVRAAAFIDWLDANDHRLVITAECIGEYFVGASDDEMASQMKVLSSQFQILPYDANAALVAAKLRSDKSFIASLKGTAGKTAVAIKADAVIVATAKAHGVDRIYSHDGGIHALAARCNLSAQDLPELDSLKPLPPSSGEQPPHVGRQMNLLDDDPAGPAA